MTENSIEQELKEEKKESINLSDLAFIISTYLESKYKIKLSEHRMGFVLKAIIEVFRELLKEDKKIRLKGFGVFETETYKERTGFSYLTKQETYTEEHKVPKFKPSRGFKKYVRFGVPLGLNDD